MTSYQVRGVTYTNRFANSLCGDEESFAAFQAQMAQQVSGQCTKCNGRGKINAFSHISGGSCFTCKGTGKLRCRG